MKFDNDSDTRTIKCPYCGKIVIVDWTCQACGKEIAYDITGDFVRFNPHKKEKK